MGNVFLGLMTLAVLVAVAYLVIVMTEFRAFLRTAGQALKNSEEDLAKTLDEVRQALQSTRRVTDNVAVIVADARDVADSAKEVGDRVRTASRLLNVFTSLQSLQSSAVRLAVKTAVGYAVKHFFGTSQKRQ